MAIGKWKCGGRAGSDVICLRSSRLLMMFYRILLWLFHIILELVFLTKEKCMQILCLLRCVSCTVTRNGRNRLQVCKAPSHVAFVIVETDISIGNVVNLIIWSAAAGIPYISVYDRAGSFTTTSFVINHYPSCRSYELCDW